MNGRKLRTTAGVAGAVATAAAGALTIGIISGVVHTAEAQSKTTTSGSSSTGSSSTTSSDGSSTSSTSTGSDSGSSSSSSTSSVGSVDQNSQAQGGSNGS